MQRRRVIPPLSALVIAAGCVAGCGNSFVITDPPVDPPSTSVVFPSTPDALMQNFQYAYESMDPGVLAAGTHPLSEIILEASTSNAFPDVGTTLDRDEQRRIAERMLSKQDVTDPNGMLIAGIQAITFQSFQRVTSWEASQPSDPIQGAEAAFYAATIRLDRGQDHSMLTVSGNIRFFVTHRDSTAGGLTRPYYQVRGQLDLTDQGVEVSDKGYETLAWGSVLAIFR